ncbi:MAG: hypothetical protein IKH35_01045 [Prevotella sp.]|nr:hypothetical protein [Prevotella sp.]
MQKIRYLIIALMCMVVQGVLAQEPTWTEVGDKDALNTAVQTDGANIKLTADIALSNYLGIGDGENSKPTVTIDLNGHTLSRSLDAADGLALNDASANTTTIESENGKYYNVTIDNRTLYKDGSWNTLCLPFDVSAGKISANGNLQNCIIMELDVDGWYDDSGNRHDDYASGYHQTGYDDGTLYLYFQTVTDIDARRPYLIKWTKPEGYDASPSSFDFTPTFFGSYIESCSPRTVTSIDGTVSFKGIYDPVTLDGGDKSSLYLGVKDSKSALFYPNSDRPINAFRAYFQLNGIEADDPNSGTGVRAFVLNFGDEGETTGIVDIEHGILNMEHSDNAVYDLQGRRVASSMLNVQSSMLKKGIYIYKGKKVIK